MYSLRAQFGSDTMKNAVHGSSTVEKAEKVIKEFFPEVEILPDGTVKGLNLLFITTCAACASFVFFPGQFFYEILKMLPYTPMTTQQNTANFCPDLFCKCP